MTPEERRKRMEERMASMTPEERERMHGSHERARGAGWWTRRLRRRAAGRRRRARSRGRTQRDRWHCANRTHAADAISAAASPATSLPAPRSRAAHTTIDSLFGPLQTTETRGRAWLYENKQLKSVALRLGVTDGTYSEVLDGDLKEGQEVVVNMVTGLEPVTRPGQTGTGNPLMGPQRGGPGGGGDRWRWRRRTGILR